MPSPPPSAADSGPPCPHCGEPHPAAYTHCPKTGKPLTSGRALVGRVIAGRYRVIGLLGEGGMGAVYVAEHTLIGRKVAIKRLHPELASDEKAVQRFQREARAAASTGHEHIVEILDLGYAEDGAPYLVMEYLRGQSLAALLRKEHRLPAERACDIVGQALAALDAVHRQQIVHRDLKPDNVFLTRRSGANDWVKILDFGISKMKREEGEAFDLTRTGVMLGTPFYMSPEQARGMKSLDHRVDLYAVGVILYECLTGRVPFEGDNYHQLLQSILRAPPPAPRELVPDVDAALEALVLRAIAKDPGERFQSASELLEALLPFGARSPSPGDVLESAEGPAVSLPTGLVATTPISPDGHAHRIESMREPSTEPLALGRDADAHAAPAPIASREVAPPASKPTPPPPRRTPEAPSAPDARPAHRSPPLPRPSLDPEHVSRRPTPHQRLEAARASVASAHTALSSMPITPPPSGGARYFFAASDDWDESRASAAIDVAARSTPSFRDAPSGSRDALREPSGSFGLREASGSFGAREASGSFGAREPSGAFGVREASGSFGAREGSGASGSGTGRTSIPRDDSANAREPHALASAASAASASMSPPTPSEAWGSAGATSRPPTERGSEVEVKGSLVIAALDHLESAHGPAVLDAIRAQLDPDASSRLGGVILPMAWIASSALDQLLRAAERVAGGGEESIAAAIGRACADRELPTTHRLFMQTASPAAAAERIPQLYRLYHSRGDARVMPTPGGGVRVEIESGAPETLGYAWMIAGFWQRMLELTGARDVRVAVVSCRGRGDDRTAMALRWR